eukprot:XP_014063337.1 PREDICTED: uncharacterized protein LOC106609261 [Salmo salar]
MSYKVFLEKLGLESNRYRKTVPEPPKLGNEDLRAMLSSFLFPMSLSTFQSLTCRIGRITRADLRQALEVPQYNLRGPQGSWSSRREPHTPRPRLSPAQVRELLILLDPEHTGVITQPSLKLLNPRRVHRRSWRMWLRDRKFSVKGLLRDKLSDQIGSMLEALVDCDPRQTGCILDDSWITLDEKQFRKLNVSLGFKDRKMSCSAFLAGENQAREWDQAWGGNRGNLRAKPRLLTVEDCLSVIKERIENIHGDILSAFRVMDKNCDSVVDRHDFRELYESLGLVTKKREYQRLLQLLGLQPGANLNYPVLPPRSIQRQDPQAEFHASQWVICHFDEDGQGLVFKKDLRSLLCAYDLPISPDELEELWARYDGEGRGYLTCAPFLEKLVVDPQKVGHARKDADTTPTHGLPKGATLQGLRCRGYAAGATLQDVERVVHANCEGLSSALTRLDKKREGLPLPISEKVVSARLYTITKELVDLDHTHNDTISKEDLRMMCDQFERVWEKLPVHSLGDLEYREFLKDASGAVGIRDKTTDPEDICPLKSVSPSSLGPIDRSSSPLALQRPKTTGSNLQRSKSEVGVSSRARCPSTAG